MSICIHIYMHTRPRTSDAVLLFGLNCFPAICTQISCQHYDYIGQETHSDIDTAQTEHDLFAVREQLEHRVLYLRLVQAFNSSTYGTNVRHQTILTFGPTTQNFPTSGPTTQNFPTFGPTTQKFPTFGPRTVSKPFQLSQLSMRLPTDHQLWASQVPLHLL